MPHRGNGSWYTAKVWPSIRRHSRGGRVLREDLAPLGLKALSRSARHTRRLSLEGLFWQLADTTGESNHRLQLVAGGGCSAPVWRLSLVPNGRAATALEVRRALEHDPRGLRRAKRRRRLGPRDRRDMAIIERAFPGCVLCCGPLCGCEGRGETIHHLCDVIVL